MKRADGGSHLGRRWCSWSIDSTTGAADVLPYLIHKIESLKKRSEKDKNVVDDI